MRGATSTISVGRKKCSGHCASSSNIMLNAAIANGDLFSRDFRVNIEDVLWMEMRLSNFRRDTTNRKFKFSFGKMRNLDVQVGIDSVFLKSQAGGVE